MTPHAKLPKAPYVKPIISRVPLRSEEAVLITCKSGNSPGPNSGVNNCSPGQGCDKQSPT